MVLLVLNRNMASKMVLTLQKVQIGGSGPRVPLGVTSQTAEGLRSGCRAPGEGRSSPRGRTPPAAFLRTHRLERS